MTVRLSPATLRCDRQYYILWFWRLNKIPYLCKEKEIEYNEARCYALHPALLLYIITPVRIYLHQSRI